MLGRRSPAGRLLGAVSRHTLRQTDVAIALGPTMERRLRASGATRIRVLHNWADGEAVRPRPVAGHSLRAEWGWGERFVVLYSGNLGLVHDFGTILDAAELLRDEPRVLFAFVGAGPRLAAVEAEVRRRGFGNVEFRPHVDRPRLGESLTAGDLHLVTLRDGIAGLVVPSKIYGILAAGRPTLYVGPDEGEVAEILEEGRCGARVALGDAAALAETIRDYVTDEGRRGDEGARARELFERRFGKERALVRLRHIFESLADEAV
jgi:glycosyltransferase involved in cell wall biosynthesis